MRTVGATCSPALGKMYCLPAGRTASSSLLARLPGALLQSDWPYLRLQQAVRLVFCQLLTA